jgi:hypothetical protein
VFDLFDALDVLEWKFSIPGESRMCEELLNMKYLRLQRVSVHHEMTFSPMLTRFWCRQSRSAADSTSAS